jgi:DNA-binding phage protein
MLAIEIRDYLKSKRGNMRKEKIDKKDWHIENETFKEHFAKILKENPKRIKSFKTRVVKGYNETKDLAAFLENLKIIAIAEAKTSEIAKERKMKRPNVYRILSKDSNPSFANLSAIARNLGFDFVVKVA